jgi:potassium/sodium efflux P-type ATPase
VADEIVQRLSLYGPNVLSEPPKPPFWLKLAGYVNHPMAWLLLAAGGLAWLTGNGLLGAVILTVVLVNGLFSFWQEYRAERAVATLNRLLPSYARVLRTNEEERVLASNIVPGDILILAEGDNIPADARLVEEYGLRVNNASLTGEAIPARKTAEASIREGMTDVEQPNLIFAGTSIVSGTGRAVVYATGMLTQFGRIARLTQAVKEPPSLLMQNLAHLTKLITWTAVGVGVTVFLVGVLQEHIQYAQAFVMAIGIVVACVPEGLTPTVTLSLAMAVQRLAKRGVLVKKLAVVETLGNISVICTDKSGTLTQNQMTVRHVWVARRNLDVSGVGYNPHGQITPSPKGQPFENDLETLLAAAMLCNNARLNPPGPDQTYWTCLGDQTEAALRVLALKGGLEEQAMQRFFPRLHELPFDARRKRMTTIHRSVQGECAFVKGAPKEVLALCTHIQIHNEILPLDDTLRAEIMAANDIYARRALRVLALARRDLPPRSGSYRQEEIERELIFLGLAAMMDPPRPEVAAAMKTCREAGIKIVMITGDYGLTAESLARRVGMVTGPTPLILTGAELDAMTDVELHRVLEQEVLFARMAPEHKLRLVAAYQNRQEVVAVIGDGVNDAPALRKADVGMAMGLAGTDVAKEAADIILTDDNVAAVMSAIEEGRAIYDNLRKFISYIFASNVPEIAPFIAMALFHIPIALTVPQILAIDLGTDLLPALALGTEKPEPDVMRRPPRPRNQPLIDQSIFLRSFFWLGLIEAGLCYLAFFAVYYFSGVTDLLNLPRVDLLHYTDRLLLPSGVTYVLATTAFHAGVVACQVGNVFACRTEHGLVRRLKWNWFLVVGVAAEMIIILALIYWSPLQRGFEHLPLPLHAWAGLLAFAPTLYLLDWVRRKLVNWLKPGSYQSEIKNLPQEEGVNP